MLVNKIITLSLLGDWFGVSVFAEMLEKLTSGILNFIANLCGSLVEGCINIIESIGTDTSSIMQLFPVLDTVSESFKWFGATLAGMLFMLGLPMIFMSRFTDSDVPANSPFQLIARLIVSWFCCLYFIPIMNTYVTGPDGLFPVAFEHFSNLNAGAVSNGLTKDFIVGCLNPLDDLERTLETTANVATFFIMLIFFIYLCILLLKFLFFHIQKFLMATILLYTSPLAASTYVNKKTAPIWKNYISLYAVNIVTLVFNIIVMKLIESGLSNLVSWKDNVTVAGDGSNKPYTILLGVMAICAVAKIGKQMSVYIGQVFNVNGMTEQVRASLGEIGGVAAAGFAAYNGINRMTGKGSKGGANIQGFGIKGSVDDNGVFNGSVTPINADTKGKGKGNEKGKSSENVKDGFKKAAGEVGKFARKTASDVTGLGNGLYYDPNKEQGGNNGVETQQTDIDKDLNGSENGLGKQDTENKGSETSTIPNTSNDDKSDKKNSEYIPGSPDNYRRPDGFEKKGAETTTTPKTSNDNKGNKAEKNGAQTSVTPKTSNSSVSKNSNDGNGTSVGKTSSTVQGGSVKGDNVNGGNKVESVKVSNHSNNNSTTVGNGPNGNSQPKAELSGGNTKNVNTTGANTHSYDGTKSSTRESSHSKASSKASKISSTSAQTTKNDVTKTSKTDSKIKNRESTRFDKKNQNPADTK